MSLLHILPGGRLLVSASIIICVAGTMSTPALATEITDSKPATAQVKTQFLQISTTPHRKPLSGLDQVFHSVLPGSNLHSVPRSKVSFLGNSFPDLTLRLGSKQFQLPRLLGGAVRLSVQGLTLIPRIVKGLHGQRQISGRSQTTTGPR